MSNEALTAWPSNNTYSFKSDIKNSNTQIITIKNASSDIYHIGVYPSKDSLHSNQILFTITLSMECGNYKRKNKRSIPNLERYINE